MLLAVYVERINPGEFGVAQPWYYIFKQIYSKQKTTSDVTPIDPLQNFRGKNVIVNNTNHWIDSNPVANGIRPSISTINLTKVSYMICFEIIYYFFFRNLDNLKQFQIYQFSFIWVKCAHC